MPELRQNIITRDWVIISSERAKRPSQFAKNSAPQEPIAIHDSNCPFCPGNEHQTEAPVKELLSNQQWQVRIVSNKFPALVPDGTPQRTISGIYRSMPAIGRHEVVIEHRKHNLIFSDFNLEEASRVFQLFQQRYLEMKQLPSIESIVIFRNHGAKAGTSLIHPHSQIVGMPVVPHQQRTRVEIAQQFFDDQGECIFCRTLNDELHDGRRIILETEHFVSFIPYAALSPFHMWIYPKRHMASFEQIEQNEITDLARNTLTVLKKLHQGLNNPDYNFTIRSVPTHDNSTDYFHWYLAIVPRLSIAAGFELGTGMFISPAIPEDSARFLQSVNVQPV